MELESSPFLYTGPSISADAPDASALCLALAFELAIAPRAERRSRDGLDSSTPLRRRHVLSRDHGDLE